MTKERRLGRGLEALLGGSLDRLAVPATTSGAVAAGAPASGPTQITVFDIDRNPHQPRREFDDLELAGLTESLRTHGLLQPVLVRRLAERYQLVAGERRLRAAINAGWQEIPAIVVDIDDRQSAEVALVENLQRKDLSPLDKATSFRRYLEQYACTQEELAGRLNLDRSTIANLIRLLELPGEIQTAIREGHISQGHARALLPLDDDRQQVALCQRIASEQLSVRATEELVDQFLSQLDGAPEIVQFAGSPKKRARRRAKNPHLAALEQELKAALGTRVELKANATGKGRLIVHFANHDEFERLRDYLGNLGAGLRSAAG